MDCEMIALVDENDKIIGYGNEEEVHKDGTPHQAVTIVFMHCDGGIWSERILIHRSKGLWTCNFHAHIKKGEKLIDAAFRIVQELLHMDIPQSRYDRWVSLSLNPIGIFEYRQEADSYIEHEINHVFVCQINTEYLGKCLSLVPDIVDEQESHSDEDDQMVFWIEFNKLEKWMLKRSETLDPRFITISEMLGYSRYMRNFSVFDDGFSHEWDSTMRKKEETLSLRSKKVFSGYDRYSIL